MSTIALSNKAAKLMKLCDVEGFKCIDDLLAVSIIDSVCPAICMTEGCVPHTLAQGISRAEELSRPMLK
jgi:hypothetical protein